MKIRALLVIVALWLGVLSGNGFCSGSSDLKRGDFPVVLMYHDIKPAEMNGFDVSVHDFRQQLDWLQANGYRTLTMDEFIACLAEGRFPEKTVLITFDDGYEGAYVYAAPELRRYGMKAAFFIIKDAIGTKLPGYPYMTETQIKELSADPLFSIEPHTLSHPDLSQLSGEALQAEVGGAKAFFEKLTGKSCETMAFPYGYYNKAVLSAVREAGYKASFAVSDRGLFDSDARFSIPRIYMGSIMSKNDMALFKKFVTDYHNMPSAAFAERYGPML
jgi:Predicted xylanase/chitin deacetylase